MNTTQSINGKTRAPIGSRWQSPDTLNEWLVVAERNGRIGVICTNAQPFAWDYELVYWWHPGSFETMNFLSAKDLSDEEAQSRYGRYPRNQSGND